jgi:UDP-galactopyranose mutase
MYDYLIVGAGLFGSTFARLATSQGKKCLVLEKRPHIGGNCYTENVEGINVHRYGPHIFHTSNEKVWEFINQYAEFNNYINSPVAYFEGKLYCLPFNMHTFYQIWGVITPEAASQKIEEQRLKLDREPQNLEEQALSMVGSDIYERLIKGYTLKQWMKDPKELPPSIIKRLPVRFTFDNNYFNDKYQGIPIGGYTNIFVKMLDGIEVKCDVDYLANREYFNSLAKKIVYTGKIDEFYDFEFGELDYRTLRFENELLPINNYQGNAVINYTSADVPYTRIIEHKHFEGVQTPSTYITREHPEQWSRDRIPYYPINNDANMAVFSKYKEKAKFEQKIIFGGRLAEYKYYDMHAVIGSAMLAVNKELNGNKVEAASIA